MHPDAGLPYACLIVERTAEETNEIFKFYLCAITSIISDRLVIPCTLHTHSYVRTHTSTSTSVGNRFGHRSSVVNVNVNWFLLVRVCLSAAASRTKRERNLYVYNNNKQKAPPQLSSHRSWNDHDDHRAACGRLAGWLAPSPIALMHTIYACARTQTKT